MCCGLKTVDPLLCVVTVLTVGGKSVKTFSGVDMVERIRSYGYTLVINIQILQGLGLVQAP